LAELLGLDAEIVGRDIAIGADPAAYRTAIGEVAGEARARGALVTTHKVDLYRHAGDLFADLDPYARLCREVSCVSKRDGRLVGHAKDPITAGLALDEMLGPGYWRDRDAHVLCLGAGGAGTAIAVRLASDEHPPARIVVTDAREERLDALRAIADQLHPRTEIELRRVSRPEESDALLLELPPESLVVNATGMGKDVAGSPITDAARFPERALAWELNYRGELAFLRQARAQERSRAVRVHDGWRYFLHGWAEVIAEVFDVELDRDRFDALAAAADPFRPAREG
jgi:shikimate 5-dehydrogenase